MYKYDRLGDYLRKNNAERVTLTFHQITDIIQDELPPSAHKYAAWWSSDPKHVEAQAWLGEGYKTEGLSLTESPRVSRRLHRLRGWSHEQTCALPSRGT